MLPGFAQFFEQEQAAPPPLPYDAEVEYLQKTMTSGAWLKLPPPNETCTFDVKIRFRIVSWYGYSSSFGIKGDYPAGGNSLMQFIPQNGIFDVPRTASSYGHYMFPSLNDRAWHTFEAYGTEIKVDGNAVVSNYNNSIVCAAAPVGLGLFAACSYQGNMQEGVVDMYVSDFSYHIDSTLRFDGYAVRFTNELGQSEGALYDAVSGQLFRNVGTGVFTVGPDKS